MSETAQVGHIVTNTAMFARSMILSLSDMIGMDFEINRMSFMESSYRTRFATTAMIHYIGSIHGDYILSLDDITALRLIGEYDDGMTDMDFRGLRDETGGFVKELLNTAV